jgi:acyl carrier protein
MAGTVQRFRADYNLQRLFGKMNSEEILTIFTRIIRDLLMDDSIVLTMETRRENVSNWDSFNYINFIVVVEIEFKMKFKVSDIESFGNIGEIVEKVRCT